MYILPVYEQNIIHISLDYSPMAYIAIFLEILLSLLSIFLFYLFYKKVVDKGSSIPTDWPVLCMLPAFACNAHRIHEFLTDIVKESGSNFMIKGPLFAHSDIFITSDPVNVHYMLSKNFPNYPKGPDFRKIFDVLGDGIFNSDADLWELHRRITMSIFHHPEFQHLLETTIWRNVEKWLIPFLEHVAKHDVETDLQEVFQRFTFYGICKMVLDYDPESSSIDSRYIPSEKIFAEIEEAVLYRHVLPESVWKLQSWLQIGKEKRLTEGTRALDQFIYKCISAKQEELSERRAVEEDKEELGLLTAFMNAYKEKGGSTEDPSKFLKDTLLNLIFAGRDTSSAALAWFFYLIAKNPLVEDKLLLEAGMKLGLNEGDEWRIISGKEIRDLVYLHGAVYEVLRLFPPIALQHKSPSQDDILPSGHRVSRDTKIVLSFYSMGRMESIWGKDCLEFKPERWITEQGGSKHEPSFKLPAFNAGPRTCIGKQMALTQMKIIATTIIYNYHVELVEDHRVIPADSVVLQMKYDLKVKLTKRNKAHKLA